MHEFSQGSIFKVHLPSCIDGKVDKIASGKYLPPLLVFYMYAAQ